MKTKLVILVVLIFLLQFFWYYRGVYKAPPPQAYRLEEISVPEVSPRTFFDKYTTGRGVVIFDRTNSSYLPSEITPLLNRLISRGFSYEFLDDRAGLEEKLKYASSLVVISPGSAYESSKVEVIRHFLDKGGRLLLISDPQRPDEINSLSSHFGIIFEDGYLYNMKVNEGNFRNIYLEQFAKTYITENLKKVVFYSSCPITAAEKIMFGDENTLSSTGEVPQLLSPAALAGNVLAVCDLTFLTEPYDSIEDNPQLISNIADFLTQAKRVFELDDFPYLLGEDINIVYADSSLLTYTFKMRRALDGKGSISAEEDPEKNNVFLALYKDYDKVAEYLDNISISDGKIDVPGFGEVDKERISLLHLHEEDGRKNLVLMADTNSSLEDLIDLVEKGEFADFMIDGRTAVIPTEEKEEA
jgi:hypothetical protein